MRENLPFKHGDGELQSFCDEGQIYVGSNRIYTNYVASLQFSFGPILVLVEAEPHASVKQA